MTTLLDYLRWRGDLLFSQAPFSTADAMIFCRLSYLPFPTDAEEPFPLSEWLRTADVEEDQYPRMHPNPIRELLSLLAGSRRFAGVHVAVCREEVLEAEEEQFAAQTFLTDDGGAAVAFRGTDSTIVGWKEDFNMSFRQTVPCQLKALEYVHDICGLYDLPVRLCGHSKGGNMAVFAAARSSPQMQESIREIYNFDGPGFTGYLMGDPGYLAMVPRIRKFVPRSSLVGMLMEQEETYTVVRSSQMGVLQHDIMSWEILGCEPVAAPELAPDARILSDGVRQWLSGMTMEERNRTVETLFSLLSQSDVDETSELLTPASILNYIRLLGSNTETKEILSSDVQNLALALKDSLLAYSSELTAAAGKTFQLPKLLIGEQKEKETTGIDGGNKDEKAGSRPDAAAAQR